MADPSLALHIAILAALNAACTCAVYDAVPQGASYPYLVLNDTAINNQDLLNGRLDERFIYLSIWSRVKGQAEVLGILSEIDSISGQPITLTTGKVVSLRVMRKDTNRDADGFTFMGRATLRILTTH
jgi:hypothetical protein